MKEITFNSYWGNFNYEASMTLSDEILSTQAVNYVRKGIANDMYRAAGSGIEKVFETAYPAVKERSKLVDASDRGRRAVPNTPETVLAFEKAANDMTAKIATDDGGPLITVKVTGQHEYGAEINVATKEATELWTKLQSQPEPQFAATLVKLGLTADYTDEQGVIACRNFMLDIKRKAVEAAKAGLAGL